MTSRATFAVLAGPLRQSKRQSDLMAALGVLPDRQQVILRRCYLEGRPHDEIAESLALTDRELLLVQLEALRALGAAIRRIPS